MKIKDLLTALEGLDPELPVCVFSRGTDSYLDIAGVYETGEMRWHRVEIEVEQTEEETDGNTL